MSISKKLRQWVLAGYEEPEGFYETEKEVEAHHHTHSWWKVMCLTGVDYFSTLGYQPGIAALAAGALSPIATMVLVLLTLFGALPMYKRVAKASPHGDGSISMLAGLLPYWYGKLFVLSLIGFAATGFIITITLSAADATAHIVENPMMPHGMEHWAVLITLVLIGLLGAVFLKGFNEAIGIAVALVAIYIVMNCIVVGQGIMQLVQHPDLISGWQTRLFQTFPSIDKMAIAAVIVFPQLALGLSGFETGVVVMPLVKGDPTDDKEEPAGRIRNAGKLLTAAAALMSVLLIGSSTVTTMLIKPEMFQKGHEAYGRALAYMAHTYLGDKFGTAYDIITVLILWFAGASAMAGLLNIVPRYLPRYGMAPEWTRAVRPLVMIFTGICFLVTVAFKADVEAQAGAYATGVLALMLSATVAVTLSAWRRKERGALIGFSIVTVIFTYTLIANIIEHPEGLRIASLFIAGIVFISVISRLWRVTELRVSGVHFDDEARRMIMEMSRQGEIRFIANHPDTQDVDEYSVASRRAAWVHHFAEEERWAFLEVNVQDASNFSGDMVVRGVDVSGFWVLRCDGVAVPNAIAALLLEVSKMSNGRRPHVYFNWIESSPLAFLGKFLLSGQGDVAPLTHEILRRAVKDANERPVVHAAG
ncbi:MAG: amino acid transporter [Armatimonadaceae bacterium]|jgi:hypothetical protein